MQAIGLGHILQLCESRRTILLVECGQCQYLDAEANNEMAHVGMVRHATLFRASIWKFFDVRADDAAPVTRTCRHTVLEHGYEEITGVATRHQLRCGLS